MADHLGKQRVERAVRAISRIAKSVCANSGSARRFIGCQGATARPDRAVRGHGFHVHPGLDRIPARSCALRVVEPEFGEGLAGRQANLCLHQVDARDGFRNRMLDLKSGVGLNEHEGLGGRTAAGVDQEFEGAQVAVPNATRKAHGSRDDLLTQILSESERWRNLDDLLKSPLNAAFTLAEVHNVAV